MKRMSHTHVLLRLINVQHIKICFAWDNFTPFVFIVELPKCCSVLNFLIANYD